jgi:hypothetical protein
VGSFFRRMALVTAPANYSRPTFGAVYQALDRSNGTHAEFYDDGVGTSSFKQLALLAGALDRLAYRAWNPKT